VSSAGKEADGLTFCLIPARSGSRRVPNKNLQQVGGISLLERSVRVGIEAFGACYCSTDSAEYAAVARSAGAQVPELRPVALALDDTPMDQVVQHAVNTWARDEDFFVLLQPSSPFTTPDDARRALHAVSDCSEAVTAVTTTHADPANAFLLIETEEGLAAPALPELFDLRTQDVPRLFLPTGGVFATRLDRLRAGEPLVAAPIGPIVVAGSRSLDIDEPADLEIARRRTSS
jgi:CMP-N-acetylneuraminic acid synthetase